MGISDTAKPAKYNQSKCYQPQIVISFQESHLQKSSITWVSVNVIKNDWSQSDRIKRLSLYLMVTRRTHFQATEMTEMKTNKSPSEIFRLAMIQMMAVVTSAT